MALLPLRIIHTDTARHGAFLRYISRIFPRLDFRPWYLRGGWTSAYEAFTLTHAEEIVANVSVTRMRLLIDGREVRGAQLGAVGCVPEMRGHGLMRPLLERVSAQLESEADLLLLYANDGVPDFYPRFGFWQVRESVFELELALDPALNPAPRRDLNDPSQRRAGSISSPSFPGSSGSPSRGSASASVRSSGVPWPARSNPVTRSYLSAVLWRFPQSPSSCRCSRRPSSQGYVGASRQGT